MNNTRGVTKHTEHRNTERGGEEFTNRVFNDTNGGQGSQAGKTFKDQPTLTERTGAFKDRVTRELRRHTWDQIKQSDMREKLGHRTGGANTQNSPGAWHYSPLPEGASSPRGTTEGGKRVGTKAEAQEEDKHPGGGRLTETREVTKEGRAREETGGTRSRRRTAGPRPQPWWPTVVEQVEKEPEAETESQRARGMPGIRGAWVELRALATKAKAELRRSAAEPERLSTQVELKGGRSPTEPVGRNDEAQLEERSPEAMAGRRPAKAEPEGRGSPVELVDRWVTVEARELGAEAYHGARAAMAEHGARPAMADRGAWVTMVDSGTREAMADHGARAAMADRGAWEASMAKKCIGETLHLHLPLRRRGRRGVLWRRGR